MKDKQLTEDILIDENLFIPIGDLLNQKVVIEEDVEALKENHDACLNVGDYLNLVTKIVKEKDVFNEEQIFDDEFQKDEHYEILDEAGGILKTVKDVIDINDSENEE